MVHKQGVSVDGTLCEEAQVCQAAGPLRNAVNYNTQVLVTRRPTGIDPPVGQLCEPFRPRLGGRNSVKLDPQLLPASMD